MMRLPAGLAALGFLALSGCEGRSVPEGDAAPATAEAHASAASPAADAGRPAFAEIHPDGVAEQPPLTADGPAGPGGAVTYVTTAAPEAVIDFHRDRAEAAGLTSLTALSQGDTRAYGAAGRDGETLQVVAAPDDQGRTSVQLTWSGGR